MAQIRFYKFKSARLFKILNDRIICTLLDLENKN